MDENNYWIKFWKVFRVIILVAITLTASCTMLSNEADKAEKIALIEGGHIHMVCEPRIAR